MVTFVSYQDELKITERVDALLASSSKEELYKQLKPYSVEERLELLQKSIEKCMQIVDYHAAEDNVGKAIHYLSLEYLLEKLEERYSRLRVHL